MENDPKTSAEETPMTGQPAARSAKHAEARDALDETLHPAFEPWSMTVSSTLPFTAPRATFRTSSSPTLFAPDGGRRRRAYSRLPTH
jgi:hypothetical protein